MTRPTDEALRVVVADIGVDAAVIDDGDGHVLILRPVQTFTNAVSAVQKVLPNLHADAVQRLVRANLPDALNFDGGPNASTTARGAPAPIARPARRTHRGAVILLAAAAGMLLAGVVVLAWGVFSEHDATITPRFPLYHGPLFTALDRDGTRCEPTRPDRLAAECVTPRLGQRAYSEATVGPDYVTYTFITDASRVSVRQLPDVAAAALFVKEADRSFTHMTEVGTYVVWGQGDTNMQSMIDVLRSVPPADSQ